MRRSSDWREVAVANVPRVLTILRDARVHDADTHSQFTLASFNAFFSGEYAEDRAAAWRMYSKLLGL